MSIEPCEKDPQAPQERHVAPTELIVCTPVNPQTWRAYGATEPHDLAKAFGSRSIPAM